MADQQVIKLIIRDTENIVYEGQIDRISSFNEVGRFDVLHTHANFISILHQEISLYERNQKIKQFDIEQAVMKVKNDVVHIFLGVEAFALDDLK